MKRKYPEYYEKIIRSSKFWSEFEKMCWEAGKEIGMTDEFICDYVVESVHHLSEEEVPRTKEEVKRDMESVWESVGNTYEG